MPQSLEGAEIFLTCGQIQLHSLLALTTQVALISILLLRFRCFVIVRYPFHHGKFLVRGSCLPQLRFPGQYKYPYPLCLLTFRRACLQVVAVPAS